MKKLISVILALVLILSCLPLSAAAKEASIEAKFRLLLEDMELDPAVHQADRYDCSELAQYPADDPDWVLISAYLIDMTDDPFDGDIRWAILGNKLVRASRNCAPFSFGFGVYDVKNNAFYDLTDAWEMDFAGLHEVWNDLPTDINRCADGGIVQLIGDADGDGTLSILDATRIQRVLVGLESEWELGVMRLHGDDFLYGYPIGCVADYDRDGSLSILDATKIQRHLVELPNNIDYKTEFDRLAGCGSGTEAVLVRSAQEFSDAYDRYFVDYYPTDSDRKKLFEKYNDEYFKDRSLLLAYVDLDTSGHELTVKALTLGDDERLSVTIEVREPEQAVDLPAPHLVCLSIYNGYLSDVNGADVILTDVPAPRYDAPYAKIVPNSQRTVTVPDDMESAGYRPLDTAELDVSVPNSYDDSVYVLINASAIKHIDDGHVLLLRGRDELDHYLPGVDVEGKLNGDFFKDSAVIAMITHGGDYNARAELTDIALTLDGATLYTDPAVNIDYQYDEEGNPIEMPTDPVVWKFLSVKQSDVEDVKSIAFWKKTQSLLPDVDYADIPFSIVDNYFIRSGDLTETDGGYHVVAPSQVRPSLDALYVGYNGEKAEPDDHRFTVESWISSDYFDNGSVIVLRMSQGSSDTRVSVDKVYRSGDGELTVDVTRHYASTYAVAPDMCWRIYALSIPRLERRYTVKVASKLVEDEYNGFKYFVHEDEDTGKKTVEITGYVGGSEDVVIPEEINGITVTAVSAVAFAENDVIKWVSIPDTVSYIGPYAFTSCPDLAHVSIPESAMGIEEGTFLNCPKLQDVNFYTVWREKKLTHIGAYAFNGCTSLKSFYVPDSVTDISRYAFTGCPLTNITLPKGIKRIEDMAFGFDENNDKADDLTVYCYSGPGKNYCDANGFSYVLLDNSGVLEHNVVDSRFYTQSLRLNEEPTAIYMTSADELAEAIEVLYTGNDGKTQRPDGDEPLTAESLNDEWFSSHDLIAVRAYKDCDLRMDVREVYAAPGGRIITVSLVTDYIPQYFGGGVDEQEGSLWCFFMIGIEKREEPASVLVDITDIADYVEKPIIYLYPEQETELTVTLGKPEELTCTYPAYNTGWHITAKPDGTLIGDNGRSYYALYWESKSRTPVRMTDGFVVKGEDTAEFLEEKLAVLGLNEREAQEFIIYWLPQMQDNEYNLIRFATAEEIERIMPLSFSVQPDTVIRVLMQYKALDEPIDVPEQKLTAAPERKGFVAVEWGGSEMK